MLEMQIEQLSSKIEFQSSVNIAVISADNITSWDGQSPTKSIKKQETIVIFWNISHTSQFPMFSTRTETAFIDGTCC